MGEEYRDELPLPIWFFPTTNHIKKFETTPLEGENQFTYYRQEQPGNIL